MDDTFFWSTGVGRSGKCELVIITLYLLNVTTLVQDHTETTHSIDIVLHVIGTYRLHTYICTIQYHLVCTILEIQAKI